MEDVPERVLVISAHPHDAEIWCGGTVARWIKEGAEVHYVLCTDGGKGTFDRRVSSQELAVIREAEQREAAKILGVEQIVVLGHPDGELEDSDDFRRELVRQIRLVRPDVLICPEPYRRKPGLAPRPPHCRPGGHRRGIPLRAGPSSPKRALGT